MKRDMDLIRNLLLHFEARNSYALEKETKIDGYDSATVQYHIQLLAQSGLIIYEADRSKTNPDRLIKVYPFNLSWAGHEFLDLARNETIWTKAKGKSIEAVGGVSLETLKALLTHYAKELFGLDS